MGNMNCQRIYDPLEWRERRKKCSGNAAATTTVTTTSTTMTTTMNKNFTESCSATMRDNSSVCVAKINSTKVTCCQEFSFSPNLSLPLFCSGLGDPHFCASHPLCVWLLSAKNILKWAELLQCVCDSVYVVHPCVCLCVHVCVHVFVCPCVCVHVFVCPCVCVSMCLCVHVCVGVHPRVCLCAFMCICLSTCMWLRCVNVCVHPRVCLCTFLCFYLCLSPCKCLPMCEWVLKS